MCLYPRLIQNRKYVVNNKNNGNVPIPSDRRAMTVPVGCGKCKECMNRKARDWSIRLQEEVKTNKTGTFVTLTFSTESLKELKDKIRLTGYELDNEICKKAVRLFLERWRKKHKKSVRHWLISEIGGGRYEHVHLHGIIFSKDTEEIKKKWEYGFVFIGDFVNEKTANYCVKYCHKTDIKHPNYTPVILCSKGIGANYTTTVQAKIDAKRDKYRLPNGREIAIPTYYRNKMHNDETRERLWMERLNEETRYVDGVKVSVKNGDFSKYAELLKYAQRRNKWLGYGNDKKNWDKIRYENEMRELKFKQRLNLELD